MATQESVNRDGQDEIDASKAPLMDHLIELRQRLIYSLIGIGIAFIVCFFFAKQIYNVLVWPYQWARGDHQKIEMIYTCLLYTSPSPRDRQKSRMPSSA